jgi:hypothetical protein
VTLPTVSREDKKQFLAEFSGVPSQVKGPVEETHHLLHQPRQHRTTGRQIDVILPSLAKLLLWAIAQSKRFSCSRGGDIRLEEL